MTTGMVFCKGFHRRVLAPVFLALARRYLAPDDPILRAFQLHYQYYTMLNQASYTEVTLHELDCILDKWRSLELSVVKDTGDDSLKPKLHFTSHYTDHIRRVSCLLYYRCYGMESFHQQIIRTWAASNRVNFSYNVLVDFWYSWRYQLRKRAKNYGFPVIV